MWRRSHSRHFWDWIPRNKDYYCCRWFPGQSKPSFYSTLQSQEPPIRYPYGCTSVMSFRPCSRIICTICWQFKKQKCPRKLLRCIKRPRVRPRNTRWYLTMVNRYHSAPEVIRTIPCTRTPSASSDMFFVIAYRQEKPMVRPVNTPLDSGLCIYCGISHPCQPLPRIFSVVSGSR